MPTDERLKPEGQHEAGSLDELSMQEKEILRLIASGYSSAEMAQLLALDTGAVASHRHQIMAKLGIHSIAGLTKFALKHGLWLN